MGAQREPFPLPHCRENSIQLFAAKVCVFEKKYRTLHRFPFDVGDEVRQLAVGLFCAITVSV